MKENKETIVISLGGSVFVQDTIKIDFIRNFISLIKKYNARYHFIIVVGGGKICRLYQDAAKTLGAENPADLDWIGIRMTHVNAELFRAALGGSAHKDIILNPTQKIKTGKVLVGGGWKPGCSTDNDAVLLAKLYGAATIINITNTDYLYDKDPKKYKDAKPIKNATWKELQAIVGTQWKPGLNAPFDPVATRLAAELKLRLIIAGPNISNLDGILGKKMFGGSVIE